jgi:hypothetical protein
MTLLPGFALSIRTSYECLYAPDSPDADIRNWLPQFERAMYRFLREGNGVVYVHCAAGMNRSATLALAYVCKNFYFPMDVMIQTTLRQRPCMFQNPVYMNQVRELLMDVFRVRKITEVPTETMNGGTLDSMHQDIVQNLRDSTLIQDKLKQELEIPASEKLGPLREE